MSERKIRPEEPRSDAEETVEAEDHTPPVDVLEAAGVVLESATGVESAASGEEEVN